jgi:hypothetical protein
MPAQSHQSDPRILGRRTLPRGSALSGDTLKARYGCARGPTTSAIPAVMAPVPQPMSKGCVVGVDREAGLLELARKQHGSVPNLCFEFGDATRLSFRSQFDIVTAARTLQWILEPRLAVANMKKSGQTFRHRLGS